jgi:cysteine-S-conjugate beta-lyase
MGVSHQYYDSMDPADLQRRIGPRTRLVWLEAPGSVTMDFPDLPALVRTCRNAGVTCALDNTWGAGLAFNPFDLLPGSGESLAVDVSVHALTKYPSGGGDVLMGGVFTRDPELGRRLKLCHMHLGIDVGANDAEAVLRALPSVALRYRAHDAAARSLALWCREQPQFAQVLHPALAGAPGHDNWKRLCRNEVGGAAGLFSVMIDPRFDQTRVDAFCDALRLFKLGYSWGGPISLVVPYKLGAMRPQWPALIQPGTIVRFAIGLEDEADLRADIAQALAAALG